MLELSGIKKYYKMGDNVVKALDGVSLTILDGEFVTVIGPSGSGKSTMMNILGCLDVATEGTYKVDGVEISKYTENQLAFLRNKKMGFIFQGFNLLQNMTAYENVELPLIYQGIGKAERQKRVLEALTLVGMKERMKHKPSELSGGQQQRVAIARALATRPMCILADEPTGNLDSVTGNEIMQILRELNSKGTTVVIITHNDEIAAQSRRVVRIHDGKIDSDTINESVAGYGVAKNEWIVSGEAEAKKLNAEREQQSEEKSQKSQAKGEQKENQTSKAQSMHEENVQAKGNKEAQKPQRKAKKEIAEKPRKETSKARKETTAKEGK